MRMQTLHPNDCLPCERIHKLLDTSAIYMFLKRLGSNWELTQDQKKLIKKFYFKNHYQTIAFINTISWMTHFKNHPPELEMKGEYCLVRYTTAKLNSCGLSEYDFLCASKVEQLFAQSEEKK